MILILLLMAFVSVTCAGLFEDFSLSSPSSSIQNNIFPRLNIKSRGFITRNSWNVVDLRAVHNLSTIQVSWNLTPTPAADELSCCSTTFLEVYPMDYALGRRVKDEAIQVVMVPFNTSTYQLDTAQIQRRLRLRQTSFRPKITTDEYVNLINFQRYVVCIRLWHRLAGKDRIVDESCANTVISPSTSSEDEPSTILIVFIVIILFNILLVLTVVLISRCKKNQTADSENPVLPFTVKKWWKDVSDVLHIQQRANIAAQASLFGQVNGGLSVISSNSTTPSLLNSYVTEYMTDYASSRPPFCSPNVPRPTRTTGLPERTLPSYSYPLPGSHCYYNVFPRAAATYAGQQYAVLNPLHYMAQGIDHRRVASWGGVGSSRGPVSMIV
ncbi:hypothetical protein RvY_07768 [Ramazzottius varieornatus]|uniref:CUB domain-containing protein n=1 Tax=Ramazzottius varieornatus TaxID=947166 RepID=A0A1D1V6B9_RAMVA|nr:hypothetical protein RvY_07768 [Ramazzottius varieornatus]